MKTRSLVVVWRVTERCNLGCKFCAYDRAVERSRRDADPASILAFGSVLGEYSREIGIPILVSWLGGEPLIWQPLTKLTTSFRNWGLKISTTTNGAVLGSPQMRAHLLEHYSEITVSVDGLGAVHDASRGWAGGFDILRRGVRALSEVKRERGVGPLLRANVVLMRETVHQFPALCRELAEWGITEITFNQLGGNDRPEFYPANRLRTDQVAWLAEELPALSAELALCGVRLAGGSDYLRRIDASSRDLRIAVEDCRPGEDFLFIDETGLAAPCSFTGAAYGVPIAELRSARDLRDLPARFRAMQRCRREAACEDCHSTRVFEKFALTNA